MDWNKPFAVKNISRGRIVIGTFVLSYEETKEVNPILYSEKLTTALKSLLVHESIEVTNDFVSASRESNSENYGVTQVETIKNEYGDTHSHTVFNPLKAVTVSNIDTTDKLIKVESLIDEKKAIEVGYSEIDKIEAREFLDQHWKTVQAETKKITNKRKLNFYLSVAKEWAVANKKIEVLEDRISEL